MISPLAPDPDDGDDVDLIDPYEYTLPRFGGPWTLLKLEVWKKYLAAYTSALRNQRFRLLCVDAFAGAGECDIGEDPWEQVHPGSARIALETQPPFDELVLIEREAKHCLELRRLVDGRANPNVRIINGDANQELIRLCDQTDWKRTRAVLFLDPFGMSVSWLTLERIAATAAIDVWYLFPLNALCRQLARDFRAIDANKRASIVRILGTDAWKNELYAQPRTADLFDEQAPERHADIDEVTRFVTKRLETIFVRVEAPKLLNRTQPGRNTGGPALYALYFALSNPSPRARTLACKIARHVLDSV